jgi:hypothetical protein
LSEINEQADVETICDIFEFEVSLLAASYLTIVSNAAARTCPQLPVSAQTRAAPSQIICAWSPFSNARFSAATERKWSNG